jgi:hypothetical protein
MKKIIIPVIGISLIITLFFTGCGEKQDPVHEPQVQNVLEKTYNISKEYLALRYQTDKVLVNAEDYASYKAWDKDMSALIKKWQNLEEDASALQDLSEEMAQEKVSLQLVTPVFAYDRDEISNVFDKAPAGKKIATLAKYLGTDAKTAYQILQNDQTQVQTDAFKTARNYQIMETSATVIKDGCKVAGFVGGIVITGGTSAIAAGSTLAKAAVIVAGVDLTLEVTSDGANIALGNNNKVSSIIDTSRKVTEPVASVLTITDLSQNTQTVYNKFSAVMIFLEQSRSLKQENKIIGITVPTPSKDNKNNSVTVSSLTTQEVPEWLQDNENEFGDETDDEYEFGDETDAEIADILDIGDEIADIIDTVDDDTGLSNNGVPEEPEPIATPTGSIATDITDRDVTTGGTGGGGGCGCPDGH